MLGVSIKFYSISLILRVFLLVVIYDQSKDRGISEVTVYIFTFLYETNIFHHVAVDQFSKRSQMS